MINTVVNTNNYFTKEQTRKPSLNYQTSTALAFKQHVNWIAIVRTQMQYKALRMTYEYIDDKVVCVVLFYCRLTTLIVYLLPTTLLTCYHEVTATILHPSFSTHTLCQLKSTTDFKLTRELLDSNQNQSNIHF